MKKTRYGYDIFAKFPVNSCGVRVARAKTPLGVDRIVARWLKLFPRIEMSWRLVPFIVLFAACSIHDKTFADGAFGGACFPNGTCDTGLTCEENYCVAPPDAGHVGVHDPDASSTVDAGYACADDSAYEINDDFLHAYQTGVDTQTNEKVFPSLAICPPTDLDYYLIRISNNPGAVLNVYVTYDASGGPLQLELYNQSHEVLVNGAASSPNTVHTALVDVTVGSYYAFVHSDGVHENNYSMTISVSQ
jgi:hypothetical protein